jgi:hypothetical protein
VHSEKHAGCTLAAMQWMGLNTTRRISFHPASAAHCWFLQSDGFL